MPNVGALQMYLCLGLEPFGDFLLQHTHVPVLLLVKLLASLLVLLDGPLDLCDLEGQRLACVVLHLLDSFDSAIIALDQ